MLFQDAHVSQKARRPVVLTLLCIGFVVVGMGCRWSGDGKQTVPTNQTPKAGSSTDVIYVQSSEHVPAKAKPDTVETARLPIKNPTLLAALENALSQDDDFLLLKTHLVEAGFSYNPEQTNYITATENSNVPLIGLSYRIYDANARRSAFLVIFYRVTDVTTVPRPIASYSYLLEIDHLQSRSQLLWVEDGKLHGFKHE
jgi:hypothetical protein